MATTRRGDPRAGRGDEDRGTRKDAHVGDPDFVEVPVDRLLGDAHTAAAAERIRRGERASLVRAGAEPKGTTTISCVDADGMAVSVTHTLGVPSASWCRGSASC